MKNIILFFLIFSIGASASESLECIDENNPSLNYLIQETKKAKKFKLIVMQDRNIIYTEVLNYTDWQGEGEYIGRYSYFIDNGDEYVSFIHSGSKLKSTLLKCEGYEEL